MPEINEVNAFLSDFKIKMDVWGIIFRDDRSKSSQTLLDLEITPNQRIEVLKNLKSENYCNGPVEDALYKTAPMWIFGTMVKGEEIYIKINLGAHGANVICISFHIAERPMKYPFKNK